MRNYERSFTAVNRDVPSERAFMKIGFTGTRRGLTEYQKRKLIDYLRQYRGVFRHGDCKGADAEAQALARALGYHIIAIPCTLTAQRAFCTADEVRASAPPLARNRVIVDESSALVACPSGMQEELRSGTWATVRYARKRGIPCLIIPPKRRPT